VCPAFVRHPAIVSVDRTIRTTRDEIPANWRGAALAPTGTTMTARPHDALFKSAFEAPANAAALLRELLPAAVRDAVAWDSLRAETASFVDPALRDHHSDLVFSARLRSGEPALLYLLLEHQSTSDPAMPLRMLAYQLRIWDRFRRAPASTWLPPIVAVLVSHVAGGWTAARTFEAMFDPGVLAIPGLAALVPRYAMIVEDLAHLSNEQLQARTLAAFQKVALWLLRDARDPARLLGNFAAWVAAITEATHATNGAAAFTALITYLFRVVDPVHSDALRAKLGQLEPHAQEVAMSIADQLHDEGREQGLREGRNLGLKEGRNLGLKEGRNLGLKEGRDLGLGEGRAAALRRLLAVKFKGQALGADFEARLAAAPPETLDRYLDRVLTADSLAAVFADLTP
jgi:predicted transposase YdaD